MSEKFLLHFLLGLQYLRVGKGRMATSHLDCALQKFGASSSCDEKWRRLVDTKIKIARAQSLYDFSRNEVVGQRDPAGGAGSASSSGDRKRSEGQGPVPASGILPPDSAGMSLRSQAVQQAGTQAIRDAKHDITGLLKQNRGRADVWEHLGRILYKEGEPPIAIAVYECIANAFPDYDDLMNNLGLMRFLTKAPKKAMTLFQDVLKRNHDHMEAANNYAALLVQEGLLNEAEQAATGGLRQNQHQPHLWNTLALSYQLRGLHEKARKAYQEARCLEKLYTGSVWSTRFNLANYFVSLARNKSSGDGQNPKQTPSKLLAVADNLLRTVENIEKTSDVHVALAAHRLERARAGTGDAKADRDAAKDHLIKALNLDKDNALAWNQLGMLFLNLGDFERAVSYFKTAVKCNKDEPSFFVNLGLAQERCGRNDKAETSYRMGLEMFPKNPFLMNNLGNVLKSQNKLGEAQQCYENVVRVCGECKRKQNPLPVGVLAQAYNNMGINYIKQGNYAAAIRALEQATTTDPNLACARSNLLRLQGLMRARQAAGSSDVSTSQPSLQQRPGGQPTEGAAAMDVVAQQGDAGTAALQSAPPPSAPVFIDM